jgi:hypothetical protein
MAIAKKKRNNFIYRALRPSPSGRSQKHSFRKNLVFVIMSFKGRGRDTVYAVVKDECSKLKLKAVRVDENIGSGLIIREITGLIERAEFIICDLTHERPNVYYELGYAHGVGNEPLNILLLAKEDTQLHFDIAPFRVQYYRSIKDLRFIVSSNLRTMMEKTRGPGKTGT